MYFGLMVSGVNDVKTIHLRWMRLSRKVSRQNLFLGGYCNEKLCALIVGEFQLKAILFVSVLIVSTETLFLLSNTKLAIGFLFQYIS